MINSQIKAPGFSRLFNTMMGNMAQAYDVVIDSFAPLIEIDSEVACGAGYDEGAAPYREGYLMSAPYMSPSVSIDAR